MKVRVQMKEWVKVKMGDVERYGSGEWSGPTVGDSTGHTQRPQFPGVRGSLAVSPSCGFGGLNKDTHLKLLL